MGSGNGRGGRVTLRTQRLTLALATQRVLRPSPSVDPGEEEEDEDGEQRRAEGRAELSQFAALVAAACHKPKQIHAVQEQASIINSKFWAQQGAQDDSDDDDAPSTPEFIEEAMQAGFSMDQLS
jgi:hypothetical protein